MLVSLLTAMNLRMRLLRDDADDRLPARLLVHVDQRNPPRASLEHPTASLVERSHGVDGEGLEREDPDGPFDVCGQAVSTSEKPGQAGTAEQGHRPRRPLRRNCSISLSRSGNWR